ncbi:MAG: 50S ribosomal protein L4 [Candidatus Daviesbacteria bacterium]|nr:50S ribosomal protein L4 [Candidatus Daviesbacteria bacterium]
MPKNKKETKDNVSLRSGTSRRSNLKKDLSVGKAGIATIAKGDLAMTKSSKVKSVSLSVSSYSLEGTKSVNLELPKEIFGVKVNKPLLAQAVRVYFNNQRAHHGHTKTRSEVDYSTKKQGPQKGSGHARHGSLGAPIFVGGGIALGPKSRKVILNLPQKMKHQALVSALSARVLEGEVLGLSGVEKSTGKTKQMQNLISKIDKRNVLVIADGANEKLIRSIENLAGIKIIAPEQLNVFSVVACRTLMITKEAVKKIELRIMNEESREEK